MFREFIFLTLLFLAKSSHGMTYYEYFVGEKITSGLVADGKDFTLNGKTISIYSGAFHYFRVHPDHWRDTLKKLRAAGLNTVETYMAWNLHNPQKGIFDFGKGSGEMSAFLDIRKFIQMAREEDLFVLFRPGPYICSEWEYGGLPSWLLSDPTMHVRTAYKNYMEAVDGFYSALSKEVSDLLFQNGGSIIGVQIENEYGHFGYGDQPRDKLYLQLIKQLLDKYGFSEALYFTSDSPASTLDWGALPGVLMTANFQTGVEEQLEVLKQLQPNRPMMVMEFWTGWFDHWLAPVHVQRSPKLINQALETILRYNASVNFYMFIGGTNFGFMAGANKIEVWPYYTPIVSSYDYDAPLTEAGDYTRKYELFKETLAKHNPLTGIVDHPKGPAERTKVNYGSFAIENSMNFKSLTDQVPVKGKLSNGPVSMEDFSFLNEGNGQSYGYALYRTSVDLPAGNATLMIRGHMRDMAQIMVDGELITKHYATPIDLDKCGFWNARDATLDFSCKGGPTVISIMVENLGRINYGMPHYFEQKKGIWEGPIYINSKKIEEWEVVPLEFKRNFVNSLTNWEPFIRYKVPAAYRVVVPLTEDPQDTFLDMRKWDKGVVFLNGFNLGRYWSVGPTKSLYIPAPLLRKGDNEFVIFEQYRPAESLNFIDHLLLGIGV